MKFCVASKQNHFPVGSWTSNYVAPLLICRVLGLPFGFLLARIRQIIFVFTHKFVFGYGLCCNDPGPLPSTSTTSSPTGLLLVSPSMTMSLIEGCLSIATKCIMCLVRALHMTSLKNKEYKRSSVIAATISIEFWFHCKFLILPNSLGSYECFIFAWLSWCNH